ncbi:hypothetical protein AYB33_17755 [Leptospira santarosai]|nr:hypothetical protein AYB33_17755 [Leptospira santarosai]
MKGSRAIINGKLIHKNRSWRRGRVMSFRIGLIVVESKMTLRDIAWFSSQTCYHISEPGHMVTLHRAVFSYVIKGTRNTKRYVKAIEEAWGLPIAEIRRIYREDQELEAKGERLSEDEINKFANWYRSVLKGKIAS